MSKKTKHRRTLGELKAMIPQLIKDKNTIAAELADNLADLIEVKFYVDERFRWRPMTEFDMSREMRDVELCEIREQKRKGYTSYVLHLARWAKQTDYYGNDAGFAWVSHIKNRVLVNFNPHYWREVHLPDNQQAKVISDKIKAERIAKEQERIAKKQQSIFKFWRKK